MSESLVMIYSGVNFLSIHRSAKPVNNLLAPQVQSKTGSGQQLQTFPFKKEKNRGKEEVISAKQF